MEEVGLIPSRDRVKDENVKICLPTTLQCQMRDIDILWVGEARRNLSSSLTTMYS